MKNNGATKDFIIDLVKNKYSADPEHLWLSFPDYLVFRHKENNKWFAIIMDVEKSKLGLSSDEKINILDVKCRNFASSMLIDIEGILPAYHMNKNNWITILLDGSVDKKIVENLLDISFNTTKNNKKC